MEQLVQRLLAAGLKIATAESCTGGLIAAAITDSPGASGCFEMGLITYSNHAKEQLLGVSRQTLEQYGAVSAQTAVEMAEGVKKRSDADLALSVTGIAGPGGGTAQKPVGTVYIGLATPAGVHAEGYHFTGDRGQVRSQTLQQAKKLVQIYLDQI